MSFASKKRPGLGKNRGAVYWDVQDTGRYCRHNTADAGMQQVLPATLLLPCSGAKLHRWQAKEKASHCAGRGEGRNSRRGKVPFEAHGTKSFPVTMATAQWVPSLRTELLQPCLRNKKSLKEVKRGGSWGRGCGGEKLEQN